MLEEQLRAAIDFIDSIRALHLVINIQESTRLEQLQIKLASKLKKLINEKLVRG